jgi:hypothetical protein
MNHISKIAEMLGVQTGQYFKINGLIGTYVFTYDGLHEIDNRGDCGTILAKLLSGTYTIVQKPWMPHYDEEFYVVGCDGQVLRKYYDNCTAFKTYYKIGNCYKTYEDAAHNSDKWMKFYASDEILEV